MKLVAAICFLFLLGLLACQNKTGSIEHPLSVYEPEYATGFRILYYKDYKLLESGSYRYFLSKNMPEDSYKDSVWIRIPVTNIACMAQSHWAATRILDEMETVTGMCDAKYITDALFKRRLETGLIKNVAENQTINYELLLALQPQLLMLSFDNAQTRRMLYNIGIPTVLNGDFMENHPLGRAEWLIFVAALYDKDEEAIGFFRDVVKRYNELCGLVKEKTSRPSVFDGAEASGVWYVSGGKSYMAKFYADAGADYLWKDNTDAASLPLDFESVYHKGLMADYWRAYLPTAKTYEAIRQEKPRYADLKAWKERHIFYCDNLHTELFGMGVYQPEVILADMIKIFYPELLTHHIPGYYVLLEE